ncbi:hypothetical protein [Nostoc sp.]|uniref:hypothetical protein n=1 Tax=Nostoc sp. TaxID=1180 RepID=UPI002FF90CF8
MFIYVNLRDNQNKGLVNKFVEFYIDKAPIRASAVGYIPLPNDSKHLNYVHLYQGKVRTVFEGKAEMNLTIGELLRKEGQF